MQGQQEGSDLDASEQGHPCSGSGAAEECWVKREVAGGWATSDYGSGPETFVFLHAPHLAQCCARDAQCHAISLSLMLLPWWSHCMFDPRIVLVIVADLLGYYSTTIF
jgi:hypothetical protein